MEGADFTLINQKEEDCFSGNDDVVEDPLKICDSMTESDDFKSLNQEELSIKEEVGEECLNDEIEVKDAVTEGSDQSKVDDSSLPPQPLTYSRPKHQKGGSVCKLFACSKCSQVFRYMFLMEAHVCDDTVKPFQCSECGKEFINSSRLKRHQLCHTRGTKCSHCNKRFTDANRLKSHERAHHKFYIEEQNICSYCGMKFSLHSNLRVHLKLHSGENANLVKEKLSKDNMTSEASKYFKCEECEKTFAKEYLYQTHLDAHVAEKALKSFTCAHCDREFLFEDVLEKHMKIHVGERPYKCEFCDRTFSWVRMYKEHYQSHTGENPVQCLQCGDCFSNQKALQDHQMSICNVTEETLNI